MSTPVTRQELFGRFASLGLASETREHAAVCTVEEARALRGLIPGGHCKNLFLKDDKGAIYLIVCLEDARIDLKTAPARIGSRRLTFGKPELLLQVLGVEPGSVTPFGLINDTTCRTTVILEAAMMAQPLLNYHPLENTATTSITVEGLTAFIASCGHTPRIVALSEAALKSDRE